MGGSERKKALRKMFKLMDKNSSGSINEAEAIPFLRTVHCDAAKAKETWELMIREYDKDKNGKIEESEFITYYLEHVCAGLPRDKVLDYLYQEMERFEQAMTQVFCCK